MASPQLTVLRLGLPAGWRLSVPNTGVSEQKGTPGSVIPSEAVGLGREGTCTTQALDGVVYWVRVVVVGVSPVLGAFQ